MEAIVFGSLGTIGETSELHRRAFNQTFKALGLEWQWSEETYAGLLDTGGGVNRILAFARSYGDASVTESTATELHAYKTKVYAELVRESPSVLRPGVVRLVHEARAAGVSLGLATSTSSENIRANFETFVDVLKLDDFDQVITIDDLDRGKPAPDAHVVCMSRLGVRPSRTIAIEDTEASVASAFIAGAAVVATPGTNTGSQNLSSAAVTVSSLGDPDTQAFLIGDGPRLDEGMVTLKWLERLIDVVA
ncbi:MAG: HAD-IA family hydrolase [Acidimicrobiales bacterium]